KLALAHHPDRAGPASAPRFAQIAEAYRMLADPTARTAYDAFRFERTAARAQTPDDLRDDGGTWSVGRNNWSASWRRAIVDLLSRLSGPLEKLVASGVAVVDGNGIVELRMTAAEAARGGTSVITMPLTVPCPTCGGIARPGAVWGRPHVVATRAPRGRLVPPLRVRRRDHRRRLRAHPDPAGRAPRRGDGRVVQ